ncbi:isochorismatase family protein [Bacillus megaterium]|uniref:cysteine hydrolase family protein n=1 Tax=Priestia megaterium TaxID=1404 RepID=UPI001293FF75|nr:isochorismatase family cysteine hydrolase [Priestia megaterium]MQR88880.1 isochorismatase family protein [Priestia megaterium]
MTKALINIDYTNDFVAENGALTCGEPGRHIETFISDITREFIEQDEYVVFAIDFHKENDSLHPESALFPPHNIEGSAGRELYGKLNDLYNVYRSQANVEWMNKTRYSAFAGTDLEIKLRERQITDIYLAGVCTDICVLHTAVDAYNKGFAIYIYEKAVASFNQKGHEWALEHFKSCLGAKII